MLHAHHRLARSLLGGRKAPLAVGVPHSLLPWAFLCLCAILSLLLSQILSLSCELWSLLLGQALLLFCVLLSLLMSRVLLLSCWPCC